MVSAFRPLVLLAKIAKLPIPVMGICVTVPLEPGLSDESIRMDAV